MAAKLPKGWRVEKGRKGGEVEIRGRRGSWNYGKSKGTIDGRNG